MTTTANVSPRELRPMIVQKIGQMDDEQIVALHRVMLSLEAQQLWEEIKREGAEDWKAGKFNNLNAVIAQVRKDLAEAR